jgi:hypothetical protein
MDPILLKYKFRDLLAFAAMQGKDVYENELNKLSNLKAYREPKLTIQSIFQTYWPIFRPLFIDRLRPAIITNVEKMIDCKNLSKGYLFFECPSCDQFHLQGLSCHSRICVSCNQNYREKRTIAVQSKLLDVPHRHFVFSIARELRDYFRIYRPLFDVFFSSVNEALQALVFSSKIAVKEDRRLGLVAFLHTFGRDLKFNPHIHVLVAERTLDQNLKMRKFSYFHFEKLRLYFQLALLRNISNYLKVHASKDIYNRFNRLRSSLISKYKKGFYAHGPKLKDYGFLNSAKKVSDYITRYASRPAISEERILKLDPSTHMITWIYDPHEDDDKSKDDPSFLGRQTITEHVFRFIAKLIVHIHDKNFHSIRYFGFYANKSKKSVVAFKKLLSVATIKLKRSRSNWINMLKSIYKYHPILCSCGHTMKLNLDYSLLRDTGG